MKKLLHNKNYVLFWFATAFNMTSSNIVQFMLSLYILDITGSGALFATMLSITIFPRLLFSPLAGVLGDQLNRKKLLALMGCLSSMTLATFGLIYANINKLSIWMIYLLVILLELYETFYSNASSGIIPSIVSDEELGDATSVSNFDEGIIGIAGPIIAAMLYGKVNLGYGLLITTCITILGVILILSMKFYEVKEDGNKNISFIRDFLNGINLIKRNDFLKKLVILAPMINFFLTSVFNISIVFILREKLGVSDIVYGNYQALLSAASLIAPLLALKSMRENEPMKLLPSLILIMAIGFILMSLGMTLSYLELINNIVTIGILFVGSAVNITIVIIMNIITVVLFQKLVPINFMSRISSVVNTLATISIPIGQMIYGAMLDLIPAFWTLYLSTLGILLIYFLSKSILKEKNKNTENDIDSIGNC